MRRPSTPLPSCRPSASVATRPAAVLGAAVLSAVPTAAFDAQLTRTEGVIGGTLEYELEGDPFDFYVLMPSLSNGPTPLAILDPTDPRVMSVAWDLVHLWIGGTLASDGTDTVTVLVPPNPGLQGLAIYAQYLTAPGTTQVVDDLSNYTAFRLSEPGLSTFTVDPHVTQLDGHTATTLDDGRVLVAGGADDLGNVLSGFHLFDPQTGSFAATTGSMQVGRTAHTATRLVDGRVLVLGGGDVAGTISATGDVWDPATGLASPIAPMSSPRTQHTATLLADGRVFVAGGVESFDLSDPLAALGSALATTEVYDPDLDAWSAGPNLPIPRLGHRASRLASGRVLVTGGVEVGSIFGIPTPNFSNDCRRYDPDSNTLLPTASFSGPRAFHGQVELLSGDVLLAGGADGNFLLLTFNALSTCRVYDEDGNAWSNAASLSQARAYPNLVLAADTVCAVGGLSSVDVATGEGTVAASIETADATVAAWSAPSPMLLERALATSVAIEDGRRVLTTGSADDGADPDLTAEVFLP